MRNKGEKNTKEDTEIEEEYIENKGFGVRGGTGAKAQESA